MKSLPYLQYELQILLDVLGRRGIRVLRLKLASADYHLLRSSLLHRLPPQHLMTFCGVPVVDRG